MDPPIALTRSISVDSLLLNMRTYRNTAMDLTGATNVPTQHADSESNATAPAGQVEADPDAETIPRGDVGTTNGHGTCKATIHDLPLEILDMVFDNLFGKLRPDIPNSKTGTGSLSTWDKCLRHSRRKWLTDLALVNIMWLVMVQRRIYRQRK